MKGLVLSVIAVATAVALWRLVFTQESDRKAIRFGAKELAVALLVAVAVVGAVFLVVSTNTIRVI